MGNKVFESLLELLVSIVYISIYTPEQFWHISLSAQLGALNSAYAPSFPSFESLRVPSF